MNTFNLVPLSENVIWLGRVAKLVRESTVYHMVAG